MVLSETFQLCLAFRKQEWMQLTHGEALIAADSNADAHKERGALWLRMTHRTSHQGLVLINHQGPRPFNSGGVCGGTATAKHLLKVASEVSMDGDAVVIVGDFYADEKAT